MSDLLFRYSFVPDFHLPQIEASLQLAYLGTESLYGATRVRFEARHALNADAKTVVIDGSGEVGAVLNRLFAAFVLDEIDEDEVTIERVSFAAELSSLN